MSIIDESLKLTFDPKDKDQKVPLENKSDYKPSDDEMNARILIVKSFTQGDQTMRKPRREFNDMSVLDRMTLDQMSFNTYQPNDGDPATGDETNAWKSNAMKPVVRNKVISIAAHATARTIFPKIFAYSDNNQEELEAATVMRDLMEWSGDKSNYSDTSFYAVISALVNPAAIVYTDYVEIFKAIRGEKGTDGKRPLNYVLDEEQSGFKDTQVPVDELYIENIYEHDVQKQQWLIWRRVQSYGLLKAKYNKYDNFKYVKPGIQLVFNSANQAFYEVYDTNMYSEMGEEIIFWNKELDLKLIMVNGVLLTDFDNPNPRNDKNYPFVKFGYELIDEGRFFYYKSLAFKMKQDASIINTLYPIIIDGTYLNVFSPIAVSGSEEIDASVIIPGAAVTFSDKDTKINPLRVAQDIRAGMEMLQEAEKSIDASSIDPILSGQVPPPMTAYGMSKLDSNAQIILGLFITMIGMYVKQYGVLRLSDILQYLTIADAAKIEGDKALVYKTFLLSDKNTSGKSKTRKIQFTGDMTSEPMSGTDQILKSFEIMKEEKKNGGKTELIKVNPELFRNLKYQLIISPDILKPRSEDVEAQLLLEEYDRAINNPILNQEEITKDFLLGAYPKSKGNIEKYIMKPQIPIVPPGGVAGTPAPGAPVANGQTMNQNLATLTKPK